MGQKDRVAATPYERAAHLRRTLYRLLGGLAGTATVAIHLVNPISAPGVGRLGAVALVATGVLLGGRLLVHIHAKYWSWRGRTGSGWSERDLLLLRLLMLTNGLLSALAIGTGVLFFFSPNNWLELAMLLLLAANIALSANVMLSLIEDGGPPRGTEAVKNCQIVILLREVADRMASLPVVERIDEWLWDNPTPVDRFSGLVLVMVMCLWMSALAQAAALYPTVKRYINREDRDERQKKAVPLRVSPRAEASARQRCGPRSAPHAESLHRLCASTRAERRRPSAKRPRRTGSQAKLFPLARRPLTLM